MKVITRFAPSPTGPLHVGGARTALISYLYAKQTGGRFVLRIEDTDRERSKPEYEKDIREGLDWLGIRPDEEYRQSDRVAQHTRYLKLLIDKDAAYVSREPKKDGGGEIKVVRFRNPGKRVAWKDMIRGEVSFDTTELKDFVIAKSLSEPLFHLAVVVDDFESKITHIVRGEDHISNTPRQMLIQEAICAPRPEYAHLPLILAADRSKLSKRKHAESASLVHYRTEGILPEAMVNFLALLGWHPSKSDASEVLSFDELLAEFDLGRVQKGGAVFDVQKLRWLNREYEKRRSREKKPRSEV